MIHKNFVPLQIQIIHVTGKQQPLESVAQILSLVHVTQSNTIQTQFVLTKTINLKI